LITYDVPPAESLLRQIGDRKPVLARMEKDNSCIDVDQVFTLIPMESVT